jgi:hypothetical protein
MKRELYIHIGTPKTGTTALQNFFYINQDTLKSYGISYPLNHVWYMAHHRLGWSFNIGREYNHPAGLKGPDEEWSQVLNSRDDKILISSEILSNCHKENIRSIRQYTSGYNVKVIVYLRRQDALISSVVNQLIKHESFTGIDKVYASRISGRRNYLKKVRFWADVFGKENIIVRPYEKGQFYGDTIFSDFMHYVFGLELTGTFRLPARDQNPRLHRVALEYKRLINFLPLSIEQKRETIEPLLQFSKQLYAQGQDDFDILSPSQCVGMIQQYAQSNEQIAREFLGREDGKLFYEPLPNPNKPWKPCPGLSPDDIRQISRLIAERDQELAAQIGKAVQAGLKSDERDIRAAAKRLKVGLKILLNWPNILQDRIALSKEQCARAMQFIKEQYVRAMQLIKGICMRAMRFIYHKLPVRTQPVMKKIAYRLKIIR